MQKLVALLLIAVLAGSVTIPNVFSDEEKNNNQNNDNQNQNNTQENENDDHGNQNKIRNDDNNNDKENETKVHFGFSNATSFSIVLPNGTHLTFGFSSGTNPGQQISAFIHKIRDVFKQQETQAKQLIKDCREKARDASTPADRKTIMNECKAQLKQINQQFRVEHKQFQLDFKQFREIVIGNHKENHEDSNGQKGNSAVQNIAQFTPNQNGLEQKKPHGKQNEIKFQNTAQFAPPHVQGHGKQNGKQKHGKED